MKWNRRVIVCCGSLVLLLGFTGCAKRVRITIDPSLAPLTGIVSPGDTLQWAPATPGGRFYVHWQQGLCEKDTPEPIPATYEEPAKCIVGPLKQPDTVTEYTYTLEVNGTQTGAPAAREAGGGNPPTTYTVAVGPRHCPACLKKLPTPPPPPPPPPPQ